MAIEIYKDVVPLADRAGLPLIEVRDDIKRHFNDSEDRARILRNLEAIQSAIQNIPWDLSRISKNEPASEYKYKWPKS